MKKLLTLLITALLLISLILTGCTSTKASNKKTGELIFVANGEDFVRKGFTTKDGWKITFDNVYVTLDDITAYQTNPPYDAHSGEDIRSDTKVSLDGPMMVDLAKGDENAKPILVGKLDNVPVGHYNAISWKVIEGTKGKGKGGVFTFIGKAKKDGKTINFNIQLGKEYKFLGGEYIGDKRKGIVEEGKTADLEMTFHFDHLFGDYELDKNDDLNLGALGFEPFAKMSEKGYVEVNMSQLKEKLTSTEYNKLLNILPGLGHVGEGHCHAVELE
ncbi:DUF4382 domain-containing protein [Thermohalobacter berrensis]|uniref:DUF4382 domain-containing protein n=1 Tax=Thermohalobacter berrensis TaxID=99594 RepID=A0A419SUE0_9FIRM|nr:DUF4382 domain-containing protein [Thermohalobacter berrensis]RKD28786.1 DUF4382 domain-containing protein [Thermohalobacter berrensis]